MKEELFRMAGQALLTEDAKLERVTLRDIVLRVYGWIGALCAFFLFLLAATWPTGANAEEVRPAPSTLVAIVGENKLFLYQESCSLGGWFEKWKKAQWFYEGKPVEACWRAQRHGDGHVYADTVDADGDAGAIPINMFRKQEGV